MSPDWTILTCTFPDRATAIQIARALGGNDELEAFPQAGELDGIRYDIAEWGDIHANGQFHMGGIWRGPPETVPPAVLAFHVDRSDEPAWPRFG